MRFIGLYCSVCKSTCSYAAATHVHPFHHPSARLFFFFSFYLHHSYEFLRVVLDRQGQSAAGAEPSWRLCGRGNQQAGERGGWSGYAAAHAGVHERPAPRRRLLASPGGGPLVSRPLGAHLPALRCDAWARGLHPSVAGARFECFGHPRFENLGPVGAIVCFKICCPPLHAVQV